MLCLSQARHSWEEIRANKSGSKHGQVLAVSLIMSWACPWALKDQALCTCKLSGTALERAVAAAKASRLLYLQIISLVIDYNIRSNGTFINSFPLSQCTLSEFFSVRVIWRAILRDTSYIQHPDKCFILNDRDKWEVFDTIFFFFCVEGVWCSISEFAFNQC